MEEVIDIDEKKPRTFEPFTNRFEIEFMSKSLTADEKTSMSSALRSLSPGFIDFELSVDLTKGKIVPIDALLKLAETSAEKPSDLNVNLLDSTGRIVSTVVYKQCVFDVQFNNLLNVYQSKPSHFGMEFTMPVNLSVMFTYEQVMFNQKEIRA